ncbi:hypothetical protein EGK75_13755 [Neisseria weixii]|uniref:Immunity protein 30 domain-containing protein n=1 Tax=Neisseria weixii TaxID=1853276 RepID=A0A3N4N6Z1_9NEIS|nr:hypothetical protein [Neisseria weixii]RPD83013.1 hypothetical protein EGK74_13805 [Neisseria weixii]RPD83162.1 hypothetical protein EGK75_13755 [Neisseria weixii]
MKRKLVDILSNGDLSDMDKNNLILDLAEVQDSDLYMGILKYLDDKQFIKYHNIFIYALTFYPPEPLFDRAIKWIVNANFDIAHNAFNILNNIKEIDGDQVDNAFEYLTTSLHQKHEDWRSELIEETLNMFD